MLVWFDSLEGQADTNRGPHVSADTVQRTGLFLVPLTGVVPPPMGGYMSMFDCRTLVSFARGLPQRCS